MKSCEYGPGPGSYPKSCALHRAWGCAIKPFTESPNAAVMYVRDFLSVSIHFYPRFKNCVPD